MKRFDARAAMVEEIERFEAEVRELAWAIVQAVVREELERQPLQLQLLHLPQPRTTNRPGAKNLRLPPIESRPEPKLESRPAQKLRRRADQPAEDGPPAEAAAEPSQPVPPERQLEFQLAENAPPPEPPAEPAPPPPPPPAPAPARTAEPAKRVQWTRESIINELATWVSSGTAIDAAFMARHGPRGLVAAARKIFGRFEAAMNVTALHLSKMQPDGPPSREPS